MPLQATSGAASYDAFGGGVPFEPTYIESCFSTWLYTGTGATNQTITNGIDLAGKGGLVWVKNRAAANHALGEPNTLGFGAYLSSNTTTPAVADTTTFRAFNSNGFTVGSSSLTGASSQNYVSWTFREQPKFFDVVTYTGDTSGGISRVVSHSLGAPPGCIIVKRVDSTSNWSVWHRASGSPVYLRLNTTAANTNIGQIDNVNSTQFEVANTSDADSCNTNGATYVAYVFAHNAGGFGLTGTDNVISCGSFTTDSSGNATVDLGYEPQWVLVKATGVSENWRLFDVMRGMPVADTRTAVALFPNLTNGDSTNWGIGPTATGMSFNTDFGTNRSYIYIAIRRGPMRTPTSGTSVYNAVARTGTGSAATVTAGFPIDLLMVGVRNQAYGTKLWDRLRGITNPLLNPTSTSAEYTGSADSITAGTQTGITVGADSDWTINKSGDTYVNWFFGRAPGFMDVCCYTGTGANTTVTHNLGVVPEMMIVRSRAGNNWLVYHTATGNNAVCILNLDSSVFNSQATAWNTTTPTSSVFSVGTSSGTNASGTNYVAYLFASCPGVSKVGSYTGTGTTQVINCGFTAGSRFVLIKRTDSTGAWYVWDSTRGIVAGNDPYLLLNSTAAEVTNTDFIDTASTGFEISSTAPAAINASGGTFIFLAIA